MAGGTTIYTVEEAKFEIGGRGLQVSVVALHLELNGIPYCTVGINPGPQGTGSVQVHTLDLSKVKAAYDELVKLSVELKEADLLVRLKDSSAKNGESKSGLTTEIHLKKWLLTNVGISNVTTTHSFSITCTLHHPAFRLSLATGFFFGGQYAVDFDKISAAVKNPVVNAAQLVIKATMDANKDEVKILEKKMKDVPVNNSLRDMGRQIYDGMQNLGEDIYKYLKWDKSTYANASYDLPGDSVLSDAQRIGRNYALLSLWSSAMMRDSFWEALKTQICPQFALEVIPTYEDEKLVVSPAMPWKRPTIKILDENTQFLTFPGKDHNPIYGYVMDTSSGVAEAGALITMLLAKAESTAIQPAMLGFVPKTADKSTGRIRMLNFPAWVYVAQQKAASGEKCGNMISGSGDTSQNDDANSLSNPEDASAGENSQLKEWDDLCAVHMCNEYILEYKRTVEATLTCAFGTKLDGKSLIPGMRAGFVTGKKALFTGMISTVDHLIDCTASTASTAIKLSYCTSADAPDAVLLGKTPVAPYYGAKGDLNDI